MKPKVEPLDVADVVSSVLKRAGPLAEGVWLDGDVAPGLPLLTADATLLHQTLFNLVENAIVHGARMVDGGEVRLAARMQDGGVVFQITDNGPGLPVNAEARIFDRFFRGDKAGASGTGLGLAIVKGFASLMGAKIEAHNRRGQAGATFTLAFPEAATA